MVATQARYRLRPMELSDIPQVVEIERESFPTMWPSTAYRRELEQNRLARYLVVEDVASSYTGPGDNRSPLSQMGRWLRTLRRGAATERPSTSTLLLGFVGLWLMIDEAHIVTIAVREAHRRHGIGELLLIGATEIALANHQVMVTLECRVSNYAAQALYEKYGFRKVGIRPRYYSDNNEDAYIMSTDSIQTADYLSLFQRLKDEHRRKHSELYPATE